jgi:hypothetical protein
VGEREGKSSLQPVRHLDVLSRTFGVTDLVLGVVAVDEVLHNAAAFEQADRLAVGESVRQSWDAAVGVDVEEPLLLLCAGVEERCELVALSDLIVGSMAYFLEMSILVCSYGMLRWSLEGGFVTP